MPLANDSDLKSILVSIRKKQDYYLKSNGINRSKFMRQAIEAHERGDWDYIFIEEVAKKAL